MHENKIETALKLIDEFSQAATDWGWSCDQGSQLEAEKDLKAYKKAKKKLQDFIKENMCQHCT